MTKDELIKQIREAFVSENYPGDENIVIDNSGDDVEREEAKKAFYKKKWIELDDKFLLNEKNSLYYFSKEGFKYFLPAFMIASANNYYEMDDVPDMIVNKLTLPAEIDVVMLAHKIKQYRVDKQIKTFAFDEFLQDSLKGKNKDIHQFIKYMTAFNSNQCTTIKSFLEFMIQYTDDSIYDPKIALERYWFQF